MIQIISLLFLNLCFAEDLKSYQVGRLVIFFHKVDNAWVNKSCKDSKCLALKNHQEHKSAPISPELLVGGKNPFAARCKTVMKGELIIAVDRNGNETSLCHFSDDSYLK